jgi:hypothetical protein
MAEERGGGPSSPAISICNGHASVLSCKALGGCCAQTYTAEDYDGSKRTNGFVWAYGKEWLAFNHLITALSVLSRSSASIHLLHR